MPFYYLDYGDYLGGGKGKKNNSKSFLEVIFFFQWQEGVVMDVIVW
jgi:hypothetical protein